MGYRTADTSQSAVRVADPMQESHHSAVSQKGPSPQNVANAALKAAAGLWFLVAIVGQLLFAFYVAVFYGRSAVHGDFRSWNKGMPHAYVAGDTLGNLAVAMHLALAVIIIVGGAIQLIPQIRDRGPSLHRWNGRIYIATAFAISIVGLYMVWGRGTVGGLIQHLATTLNAILIMLCAAMALHYARARKFAVHRRWALRLFLVSGGVWFFRVGLFLWLFLNNGPAGFDPKTFTGPFLIVWNFGQFLLPLAVLELYLRAQTRAGTPGRIAMAAGLFVLTVAMGVGIFLVSVRVWLPRVY